MNTRESALLPNHLYFGDTLRVPLERGMSPFAFNEDRMVNPMDLPFFHKRRK